MGCLLVTLRCMAFTVLCARELQFTFVVTLFLQGLGRAEPCKISLFSS